MGAIIKAEKTRTLAPLAFVENSLLSRDLPRDTVLKRLNIRLRGSVSYTFAVVGTPDAASTLGRLVTLIQVIINGNRTVAAVDPYMLAQTQLLATGTLGERRSSAGAAAPTTDPKADAGFTYGTTGQFTGVAETVTLFFEQIWSDPAFGRSQTYLNLKGVASAEIRLNTATFSNLNTANGGGTTLVFANNVMFFDIECIEAQDVDAGAKLLDWKRTVKTEVFSSQTTERVVDLNRGNFITGIQFQVRDGDAAKSFSNDALTGIKLLINGSNLVRSTTFQLTQARNRVDSGIVAAYAASVSRLDGTCFLNLIKDNRLDTALDVRPTIQGPNGPEQNVDQVQLLLSTAAAGAGATYTNPVAVQIQSDELVAPVY